VSQHCVCLVTTVRAIVGLVFLCSGGLPEDGTLVPKHVDIDTYYELYFMVYALLFFTECICWLGVRVAQLVEALRYKPEGRVFDSRWCHWNFSLT